MIINISKWVLIFFGIFIISIGLLMLIKPEKASTILRKAGSTNLLNYTEITVRLIPASALIIYSDFSKVPVAFQVFGWIMLITSFILYLVPRKIHHAFSMKSADIIKPRYFQFIAPFAFLFGGAIIYNVL